MKQRVLYSEELADEILRRIPSESLLSILVDKATGKTRPGMPDYSTVMDWRRDNKDFAERYARAREDQGDYDADLVAEIRADMLTGKIAADVGRAAIDSCKWTAGRRKPKIYSERLSLEHSGAISLEELIVTSQTAPKPAE